MKFKSFMESLKGKQHKIDKNKNGKIDAHDFKLLRKEENEQSNESYDFNRAALAKQRLMNLKGKKVRGAAIANLMRSAGLKEEEIEETDLDQLDEVLSKDATASDWIHDFVHSDNPKFEGKSKAERIKMALGAYYGQAKKKQQMEQFDSIDEKITMDANGKVVDNGPKFKFRPKNPAPAGSKSDSPGLHSFLASVRKKRAEGQAKMNAAASNLKPIAKEEVERIDEISQSTASSYKDKSYKDYSDALKNKDHAKADKRWKGMLSAMKREKPQDTHRVPAGEKPVADNGRPYWGEEVKPKDKKEDPPFDGPYTKTKSANPGKYGQGYSTARHLARQGMKQAMKEEHNIELTDEEADTLVEGVLGAVSGAIAGGLTGGPIGALAGAYLGHKVQQGANNSKKLVKAKQVSNRRLRREFVEIDEAVTTTHEDPLVTVHDKDGLHTHANLSTANHIFNTNVHHKDVHAGPVKTKDGHETKRDLTFALSKHHESAMNEAKLVGTPVDVDKVHAAGQEPHEEKFEDVKKKKQVKEQYDEDGNVLYEKKTFQQFLEGMTATQVRPGVTRYTGGSYGSAKGSKYGNTDYDSEDIDKKDDESQEQQKRGRGRPAGSKSGARGPRIK